MTNFFYTTTYAFLALFSIAQIGLSSAQDLVCNAFDNLYPLYLAPTKYPLTCCEGPCTFDAHCKGTLKCVDRLRHDKLPDGCGPGTPGDNFGRCEYDPNYTVPPPPTTAPPPPTTAPTPQPTPTPPTPQPTSAVGLIDTGVTGGGKWN